LSDSERLGFELIEVAEPVGLVDEAGKEVEVVGAVEGETGVVAIELGDG
jgi:putative intracellular protease/amidase